MSYTIVEDGDTLQIRASISDAQELGELIEKLETRRKGWKAEGAVPLDLDHDDVISRRKASVAERDDA